MSYQNAKTCGLAAVGLAAIGIGLGACTTTLSSSESMTVYNVSSDDTYIAFEQPGNIGNKILWRSDVQTEEGLSIGLGSGHCTQLDDEENFFCSFVVDLYGRGRIAGHGVQLTEPEESTFPIIGGTGEFKGIVGEIRSRPVENRARFVYEMKYNLKK